MRPGWPPVTEGARDILLDKAVAHFAAQGVRDTSLRGLAPHIGTSQRMLSYHFGSREGLLVAVIDKVVTDTTAALRALFADTRTPSTQDGRTGVGRRTEPGCSVLSSSNSPVMPCMARTMPGTSGRQW